jgi:hypothetical protein
MRTFVASRGVIWQSHISTAGWPGFTQDLARLNRPSSTDRFIANFSQITPFPHLNGPVEASAARGMIVCPDSLAVGGERMPRGFLSKYLEALANGDTIAIGITIGFGVLLVVAGVFGVLELIDRNRENKKKPKKKRKKPRE